MAPRATDGSRVKAQLAKARATLETAGIPLPWLDAEILVAHVLQSSRERLHSHPERQLTVAQRARLRRLTSRRVARVPVPYLVGEREFYGYMFRVTPAVLIPRPSSELLVELAIEWLTAHPGARRMIDLGTGSGAVAISVAKAAPQVRIEARDVSARALKVADENIAHYRLSRRITTVKGDLLRGPDHRQPSLHPRGAAAHPAERAGIRTGARARRRQGRAVADTRCAGAGARGSETRRPRPLRV
jgi:release factor glutamine methyltransferase